MSKTAGKKTVSAPTASASASDASSASPDVRIEVENFGPIRSGAVDLRPLTVFVGPSNTGKTYLATLVYALHQVFRGIEHIPMSKGFVYRFLDQMGWPDSSQKSDLLPMQERESMLRKLTEQDRPLKFSDLPKHIREAITSELTESDGSASQLMDELARCFDLASMADLERWDRNSKDLSVSLKVGEASRSLWRFNMKSSGAEIDTDGKIEDLILTSEESKKKELAADLSLSDQYYWEQFLGRLTKGQRTTYYLPSARNGIMQSRRVIASASLGRFTRTEILPEIPTLPKVTLDLLQHLFLYEENRGKGLPHLAELFEHETLRGRIRVRQSVPGGLPEFYYQPRGKKQEISLTRASSMVSELAPVVLFVRGLVEKGDTLIIDEPEAHLHPAAQTQVATLLAWLVRSGVRVLVTTHSDWLLQEIGNLIREGELRGCHPESTSEQSTPPAWLRQEEVGAWLFRQDGRTSGSKVDPIPFDLVEGIDPPGYEEVAEMLYNRSIRLQNRLTEATDNDERT